MNIEIEDIIDNGVTYYVIHIPIELHFKYVKLWMTLPNPAFHSCSTRPSDMPYPDKKTVYACPSCMKVFIN